MKRARGKRPAAIRLPMCCTDMDIELIHLAFPERMPPRGREFIEAHGIARVPLAELMRLAVDMGNGMIKIRHVCDQLDVETGRCGIYDKRPRICRDFDCATRHDCACEGQGLIQVQ